MVIGKLGQEREPDALPVKKKGGGIVRSLGIGCGLILAIFIALAILGASVKNGVANSNANAANDTKADGNVAVEPAAYNGATKAKFDRLEDGMSYAAAVKVLGAEGEVMSTSKMAGVKTTMYMWKGTSFGGNMNAMFQNDKLITKSQMGLE